MWTRCSYVKGCNLIYLEANPEGMIRNWHTKKVVRGRLDNGGYPFMTVFLEALGKWRRIALHRIMIQTFKPQPWTKLEVDHRDGQKTNYRLDNLRWCTHSLNVSFVEHRGWQCQGTTYRARFRGRNWGRFATAKEAREKYVAEKSRWQKQEREKIIAVVLDSYDSRKEAVEALNWDARDGYATVTRASTGTQ